jgi:phosphoglycolate phosphatase-like HAD superfamily hydrolase
VVISADKAPKPDPRALQLAIQAVGTRGGLYVGDTADDHDLVINYQAIKAGSDPEILVAMLVHEEEVKVYQQRGADFIIGEAEDIMSCLPENPTSFLAPLQSG